MKLAVMHFGMSIAKILKRFYGSQLENGEIHNSKCQQCKNNKRKMMTATLNTYQVELNCRRIYQYPLDSLEADEFGTLHLKTESKKDHTDYKLENIPESSKRYTNITPALLATMEGMCLEMKKDVPICFFVIPKMTKQFLVFQSATFSVHSYDALVKKIEDANKDLCDLNLESTIEKVKKTYKAINYGFMLPNVYAPKEHLDEVNQYATKTLVTCDRSPGTLEEKKILVTNQTSALQRLVTKGDFYDFRRQEARRLDWITSGQWRETQFKMPEETETPQ